MSYPAITKLADEIAYDIFIADGGVDDFDGMNESEIRVIVQRELPMRLADYVTTSVLLMQTARSKEA